MDTAHSRSVRRLTAGRRERISAMRFSYLLDEPLSDMYYEGIPPIDTWTVTVEETHGDGPRVAAGELLRVTLGSGYDLIRALDDLDEYGGGLSQVGDAVLDDEGENPTRRISELVPGGGDAMLIVDTFKLDPDWRGYGLEPLLAGLALRKLAHGVKFAAIHLPRSSLPRGKGREMARAEMERPWRTLGFYHYRRAVWISDPHAPSVASKLDGLRRRFGVEEQISLWERWRRDPDLAQADIASLTSG